MTPERADHPVLIVAPLGQDASAMASLLGREGIPTHICSAVGECAGRIGPETGALLLTEEALELPQLPSLMEVLRGQPEWSELPLIVLTSGGEARRMTLLELTTAASGTVTLLERPLGAPTLLQAVQVALRSRRRQYQVRDLLEERRLHACERALHAQLLQRALEQRTKEVTAAQQQLATAERMAAVGTLAAGLAHDITNITLPLALRLQSVIADAAQKLKGQSIEDLNAVATLVDHLRQMGRNLSLFARDPEQEGSVGITNLGDWWTRVHNLLVMSIGSRVAGPDSGVRTSRGHDQAKIRLESTVPGDLPNVRIAPHRLTQAVLNLVHNARDAIFEKHEADPESRGAASGCITIKARHDGDRAAITIEVSDDGIGMSEDVQRRCIDPFFTTKNRPVAPESATIDLSGSGMGLSLVHGIVAKSGGVIEIDSETGKGTTVKMILPIAPPDAAPKEALRRRRKEAGPSKADSPDVHIERRRQASTRTP